MYFCVYYRHGMCLTACMKEQSKSKYKIVTIFAISEFLQPFKPRPETSASVARNLVAGALGLRPQITKEKRAEERQKLLEAKGTSSLNFGVIIISYQSICV